MCRLDFLSDFCRSAGKDGQRLDSGRFRRIKQGQDARFQLLWNSNQIPGISTEDHLICDFSQTFSMQIVAVYHQLERGSARKLAYLNSPYLEHFCQRLAYFSFRVGIPNAAVERLKALDRPK
jgi:hypothetical protein